MDDGIAQEQSLFDAALLITNPAEREAFLDQACTGDCGLRSRLGRLLAAHHHSERFFSADLANFAAGSGDIPGESAPEGGRSLGGEMVGKRVDRYRLLRSLGEGGWGAVYLAEQEEPVRRLVALKVIKLGMDTKNVIARFEAERQALALMDHPNIARVLDAGATEIGRPYFVMELVRGVRITTYCDENRLDVRQRLALFIRVCQAVQHAHQKGVVHRDIKPSNILVSSREDGPVPKVIDFGIAKATLGRLNDDTQVTFDGQFIGTPAYMSPEQAERSGLDIDTRSDIYSLGVLLYELLTGRTPFEQKQLLRSGLDELRRTLREEEPPRPSTLLTSQANTELASIAQGRHADPSKLLRSVAGDLDWIVMKALEKDRRRRYETANALAADVQRYLHNEPVVARPPSRVYRLQKLVQRNKAVYASGAMVFFTLLVGLGVSTRLFLQEREARMEQARLRQKAEQARAEAERARASEMQLRQAAEAREKVTQAAVLLSHGATNEADALLDPLPTALFSPSTESAAVFRTLAVWNLLEGRRKQAAHRFAVLMEVNQVDKADQSAAATVDLLFAAPLLIEEGDQAGYDHIRRMALARLAGTSTPNAAEQLIKTSLLLPADQSLMKLLEPPGQLIADSLKNYDPKANNGYLLAAWRSFALALLEYRRGHYETALDWLERGARFPDQSPSSIASVHILSSMTYRQLGEAEQADSEFKQGREMVESRFRAKLELGDDKIGRLEGWIMAPIFLREAEQVARNSPRNSR